MTNQLVLRDKLQIYSKGTLHSGWATFRWPQLVEFGLGSANSPNQENLDSTPGFLTPRLIDTHVHGGGGFSADGSITDMRGVIDFHHRFGVGTTFLSLVSAPIEDLVASIERAASLMSSDNRFIGLHLEGPFLAQSHKGAHDPTVLHAPSDSELQMLVGAGKGIVRSITVAPELMSESQIKLLIDNGIEPALGHTGCNFEQAQRHFEIGSRVLTHAFNGMPGVNHREPGPVIAAQENQNVYSELIADGVHVAPEVAKLLDSKRVILVTDAMSAAGLSDGNYSLGPLAVVVRDGTARTESGSLAGSLLTLDQAVRNYALWTNSNETAFAAAIDNPIDAYGLDSKLAEISKDNFLLWGADLTLS